MNFSENHPNYKVFSMDQSGLKTGPLIKGLYAHMNSLKWDNTEKEMGLIHEATRKRAIARLSLVKTSLGWIINRVPAGEYMQESHGDYERDKPRVFPEIPQEATENPEFSELVKTIADMTQEVRAGVSRLEMTVFLQRIVHDKDRNGTCAFEGGPHKDGVDVLVPALVLGRFNCKEDSGVSTVYDNDMNQVDKRVLKRGEGTFVNDREMYHHITNIEPEDPSLPAFRDMLGFDIDFVDGKYN